MQSERQSARACAIIFDVKYKTDSAGSDSSKAGSDKAFRRYIVRITSSNGVNIRKGPGTNYDVNGAVPKGGAYTIVDEKSGAGAAKWGKLKSGAGWIAHLIIPKK